MCIYIYIYSFNNILKVLINVYMVKIFPFHHFNVWESKWREINFKISNFMEANLYF